MERRWSALAFVVTNSSSKLQQRLIVNHGFWKYKNEPSNRCS